MSSNKDSLNNCGCCETDSLEYSTQYNRPGQTAIQYRMNTHSGFVERMLARLSRDQLTDAGEGKKRPLARLGIRSDDDPTIALLDAWGVVADVLTFYQERIANEGYIRTATERRSVLELARAIGYELNPGVAASTWLAFNADNSPGSPPSAIVAKGTQVLSIPGKDELPQTFETTEAIIARADWNALKPYTVVNYKTDSIVKGMTQLRLKGVGLGLQAGDGILIVGDNKIQSPESENWDFRILTEVTQSDDNKYTLVKWETGLGHVFPPVSPASRNVRIYSFAVTSAIFGKNAADWDTLSNDSKADYLEKWLGSTANFSVSKNGKRVVFAGNNNSLRIWTYNYYQRNWIKETVTINSDADTISAVAVSSYGTTIVLGHTGGALSKVQKTAGVWITEPMPSSGVAHVDSEVRQVAFSTESNYVLTIDDKKTAKVWYSPFRSLQKTYVPQLVATPSNNIKYRVGSDGQALSRWTFTTAWEEKVVSATAHEDIISAMAISSNGSKILSGSTDGTLKLWTRSSNDSWSSQEFLDSGQPAHAGPVVRVAFSNDTEQSEVISMSINGISRRWNANNMSLLYTFDNETLDYLSEWPDYDVIAEADTPELILQENYPGVVNKSWIVLHQPTYVELYNVSSAKKIWHSQFNMSAAVTRVALDTSEHLNWFKRRETIVYAQSNEIEPYAEQVLLKPPVEGNSIELDQLTPELEVDRMVVVTGKRMRVRVIAPVADPQQTTLPEGCEGATGLLLESADGLTKKCLYTYDNLTVISRPKAKSGGNNQIYWKPVNEGFEPIVYKCTKKAGEDSCPAGNMLDIASKCDSVSEDACLVSDKIIWELQDRNGFTGTVTAAKDELLLTLSEEDDALISETVKISKRKEERHDDILVVNSMLEFSSALENIFDHDTVSINANVAPATHGETVPLEYMGSGSGTSVNQSFVLNKTPLTYVSAATPSGGESTLEVRVNDVLWQRVDSLYQQGPRSQVYTIRHDDDGNSIITFGDGQQGARLPTGQENITATYRSGIGLEGEVNSGTLKLLKSKPLGVREVNNPLPATGAAPPEELDDARANAPLTVLTLDRIVSVNDFEDFAAAFAGVGKAQAAVLWNGEVNVVHITIATASGGTVDKKTDALYANLLTALEQSRDTTVQVLVDSFVEVHFTVNAQILIDSSYIKEKVKDAVKDALRAEFTFKNRAFGQGVNEAEVLTVITGVQGVLAADLVSDEERDKIEVVEDIELETFDNVLNMKHLRAKKARWEDPKKPTKSLGAQLLLISSSPEGIKLTEMSS